MVNSAKYTIILIAPSKNALFQVELSLAILQVSLLLVHSTDIALSSYFSLISIYGEINREESNDSW